MPIKVVRRWSNQLPVCGSLFGQCTSNSDISTSLPIWQIAHTCKKRVEREEMSKTAREMWNQKCAFLNWPLPLPASSFWLLVWLCWPLAFCLSTSHFTFTLFFTLLPCDLCLPMHIHFDIHLWLWHLLLQFDSLGKLTPPFEFCTYLHFTLFGNSNAT